uniref:DUF19 domain-containing protein n=1 Tax=Plectus sambesii TaxID=2011161 RepID=A0A914W593_9BILA
MAATSFWQLAVALAMAVIGSRASDTCPAKDEAAVSACLQPMLAYASELQAQTGAMQFPVQGANIFEHLCRLFKEFKDCVHDVHCHSLSIEAIDASYGYMCGDGYQLFRHHVECFAQVETHQKYLNCKRAATAAITSLQVEKANTNVYFAKLCSIMDQYLRCSHPIINSSCGQEAWQLVTRVTEDSLRVTMPSCDLRPALM